jgi:hypothetical protein
VFSARCALRGAADAGDPRTGYPGQDGVHEAGQIPRPGSAITRWRTARGPSITGALLLAGCVHNVTTSYPQQWSPLDAATPSACPNLAGRYYNVGELAPGTPCSGARIAVRAEWRCDMTLSHNIAEVEADDWVELRQPDADTLVVVSSDPVVDAKVMHRSHGDFSCSKHGLERTLHASLSSVGSNADSSAPQAAFNGLGTLFNLATAGTAGVRTLVRTFTPSADGSLVMDVSEAQSGVALLIPFHTRDEGFVRWYRAEPSAADATTAAAASAGAVPDVPAARFARFESMNDFIHHTRITRLDGTEVDERKGEGRPVALPTGKRWVQVSRIDHSLRQSRDFNMNYGFELDAVAGHVYRLSEQPASCLVAGNIDAALNSHLIRRVQVSLVDRSPEGAERRFPAEAMCIAGIAVSCSAADSPPIIIDRLTLSCVRLSESSYGYYGREPTQP